MKVVNNIFQPDPAPVHEVTINGNFYVLIDSFKISEDFLKFSDVLFEQNNCLLTMIGQATKIFRRFDGSIIFAFG